MALRAVSLATSSASPLQAYTASEGAFRESRHDWMAASAALRGGCRGAGAGRAAYPAVVSVGAAHSLMPGCSTPEMRACRMT